MNCGDCSDEWRDCRSCLISWPLIIIGVIISIFALYHPENYQILLPFAITFVLIGVLVKIAIEYRFGLTRINDNETLPIIAESPKNIADLPKEHL
ncbi:hypothetical protein D5b_00284 [Faustovirus]|nr:hypothetical protein D5b_00284 [Faustovirus]AMN84628.1 hypothetical protein D6_00225 [Faustovirus]